MGTAGARTRSPGGRRGGARGRGGRDQLRRGDGGGACARRADRGRDAIGAYAAVSELRHGGGDERGPRRTRLHRPAQDPQVRGQLSWARRRLAGAGRFRRRDPRRAYERRCAQQLRRRDAGRRVQPARLGRRAAGRARQSGGGDHRRTGGGQYGRGPAGPGVPRGPAQARRRQWRVAHLRRGDHGLPRSLWRRAGAVRGHARLDVPGQDHRRRLACGRIRRGGRR